MKKANVSSFEVEELACVITGLDYEAIDADTQVIDEKLFEEFNIDLVNLQKIVSHLLPLIDVGRSPLTDILYKGFSDTENQLWIIKVEVPESNKELP